MMGTILFGYHLKKPASFTAKGVIKGPTLKKTLELLDGQKTFVHEDDPKVFLLSYPVMESAVKELLLQGNLQERGKRKSLPKQIWNTLQAEKSQRILKYTAPPTELTPYPAPLKPIIPDPESTLQFSALQYEGEWADQLNLTFLNDTRFQVHHKQNFLGEGELDRPFFLENGFFTLESQSPLEGKQFTLSLIPLCTAVQSLKKMIAVKRSKNHQSLAKVSVTHTNRYLAMRIANATMQGYLNYLEKEGKRKMVNQLAYLKQRQVEALKELKETMETHKAGLKERLEKGEMLLFENEMLFIANQQTEMRRELDRIAKQIAELYQVIEGNNILSIPELIALLKSSPRKKIFSLTLLGASELIKTQEQLLDSTQREKKQIEYCLTKLSESKFDPSSFSKLINDSTLEKRFQNIHTLQLNLLDTKNWTEKERAQLAEELEKETQFLIKHLSDILQGANLQEELLKKHLKELQEALLYLLLEQYENTEENLFDLRQKAVDLPQNWLTEQQMNLSTELHKEIIESIAKLIEEKNIGYHLHYINSTPLMQAAVPLIPNSPKLLFGLMVGCLIGGLFTFLIVIAREIWLGPTASYRNLKNENVNVVHFGKKLEDLKHIYFELKDRGHLISVRADSAAFVKDLCLLYSKGGESVLLIDLTASSKIDTFEDTDFGGKLALSQPASHLEIYLGSASFQKMLEAYRSRFNRIILYTNASLNTLLIQLLIELGEVSLIKVQQERWQELPPNAGNIVYVTEEMNPPPLTLSQIVPYLERIISFSFGRQVSLNKTEGTQQTENRSF